MIGVNESFRLLDVYLEVALTVSKRVLQSAWTMRRSFAAQMAKSERTESILMTGANV
jgi:hypothetical protein